MSGIFNRLELDIMQTNELNDGLEMAVKYNIPAVVVHQSLTKQALAYRLSRRGKFMIISPIDWPKGENFGTTKFRGVSIDALEADGFEVYLSGGKNVNETANEAKAITDFIRNHIGQRVEVRFVLGVFTRDEENIKSICKGLVGCRTPAYIRTDHFLKIQLNRANDTTHNAFINLIKADVSAPIKLSGNIATIKTIEACSGASRFAVNVTQARAIVREYDLKLAEALASAKKSIE